TMSRRRHKRPSPRRRGWAGAAPSAPRRRSSTPSTMPSPRSASRSTSFRRRRSASAPRCARFARRARPDMSFVGRSVTRLEDRPLVTGRGAFAADVAFPHMLHMRLVRSAHAHVRIISIDTTAALKLPGVVEVWTSADVSEIPPIDFRLTRIEGLAPYRQPILARQRVRYVGEPVAAVFATDPYVAEDAADLVAVAVEE